jgi:hypothetical protein
MRAYLLTFCAVRYTIQKQFMNSNKILYKNSLPLRFYAFRSLLLGGFIFLLLIHVNYLYSLLYFVFAFFLTLNKNNYIIEVCDENFNLILPSFYGKKFDQSETFYYSDMSSFEFEKGFYDWKAAILGELARIILSARFMGALFAYKKPKIYFSQKTGIKTSVEFYYNQEKLIKAIELINEKVNLANKNEINI